MKLFGCKVKQVWKLVLTIQVLSDRIVGRIDKMGNNKIVFFWKCYGLKLLLNQRVGKKVDY